MRSYFINKFDFEEPVEHASEVQAIYYLAKAMNYAYAKEQDCEYLHTIRVIGNSVKLLNLTEKAEAIRYKLLDKTLKDEDIQRLTYNGLTWPQVCEQYGIRKGI